MTLSRREFIQGAGAIGATLVFAGPARASRANWREQRDLFPEGVAKPNPVARCRATCRSRFRPATRSSFFSTPGRRSSSEPPPRHQ